jgi:hypothetical protein
MFGYITDFLMFPHAIVTTITSENTSGSSNKKYQLEVSVQNLKVV